MDIWQSLASSRVIELLTERLALLALGGAFGAVIEALLHPVEHSFNLLERLVLGWQRWKSSGRE